MAATKVYSITVRREKVIVEVDRYTFMFVLEERDKDQVTLAEIGGIVHGKRDTRIDPNDQVAKLAKREAKERATIELKRWMAEHAGISLANLVNEEIWVDPEMIGITPEQRAVNQSALDQLVSTLADRLQMPGTSQRRRTLS